MKQSAILTEQDFRAAINSQCGFPRQDARRSTSEEMRLAEGMRPLQLKDREPTDAEVLSALQFALTDDQLSVMEQSYDQFQIEGGE